MGLVMKPNLATIARYYRIGIETGLCDVDDARAWAMAVIGDGDAPSGAFIDVNWNQTQGQLLAQLDAVPGLPDNEIAGRWLLADLRKSLTGPTGDLRGAVRTAMRIAEATDLDEKVYYEFDRIDEALELALSGTYGTVSESWLDFEHALHGYLPPPFPSHERRAR
jgi:hypothetical protein